MKRLLRRLLWFSPTGRPAASVVCYMRENGPIAYAIDRFSSAPRDAAEAMLDTALRWYWRSGARGWTELTRVSLSAFLVDLQAAELLVAGLEPDANEDVSDSAARRWLLRYCREEPSPLAIAIHASRDRQLVFVQQQATDAINGLLESWQVDKASTDRKAYATLRSASLESLATTLDAGA
jgi:hypothetical protein